MDGVSRPPPEAPRPSVLPLGSTRKTVEPGLGIVTIMIFNYDINLECQGSLCLIKSMEP